MPGALRRRRPHRQFARDGRALALRVAAAAATDGRDLERLHAPKDCPCGEPNPSRHHLTFDCDLKPWQHDRRTEQERRMLCAIVEDDGFAFPDDQDTEYQVGLLAEHLAVAEDDVLVATDGGVFLAGEHYRWRAASWAVTVGEFVVSGLVEGEERTAAAGERAAFSTLCKAVQLTGRRVRVLLDNLAIVQGARRRASTDFEEEELWSFWAGYRQVRDLMQLAWIPSHGKQKTWQPPLGWPQADDCRDLNSRADAAATAQLLKVEQWFRSLEVRIKEGEAWSFRALNAQLRATEPWHQELKRVIAEQRARTWRAKRVVG